MSDDWLRSELEALEASAPTDVADRSPRRFLLPLIAAATGGALLIVAVLIALPNLLRPTAVEPTQSASVAASPSVPESLPETPAATTASPSPTPEPQLGTSWTRTAAFSPAGIDVDPLDLASRDDLVVAVGYALLKQEAPDTPAPREGRVWISADGLRWEAIVDPVVFAGAILEAVAVAPDGAFLAYGHIEGPQRDTDPNAAWRSVDGRNWQRIDIGLPHELRMSSLAHGPKGFVLCGTRYDTGRHEVWFSEGGVSWEPVLDYPAFGIESARDIQECYAGAEGFFGDGTKDNGHNFFIGSADGREWIEAPPQDTVEAMPAVPHVVAVGGDWYAASRSFDFTVWFSANALDWSELADAQVVDGSIRSADWLGTARDHLFLKDAPDPSGVGSTWTSVDGIQWHKTDLAEHVRPAAITEFNGMLIIAASHYNGTLSETSFWVSDIP